MQGKLYIYLDNIYTLSYMEVDIFQRFNFQRLDGLFRYKKNIQQNSKYNFMFS